MRYASCLLKPVSIWISHGEGFMAKNIVFCADGTWNGPGQDDGGDKNSPPTNVFKLAGADAPDTLRLADECQFASNCDPLFASNNDPSARVGMGLSA